MKTISVLLCIIIVLSACGDSLSKNAVASVNGECTSTHMIKGNKSGSGEWIYHKVGGQYYKRTDAEECFANEVDAQNAGYRKSKR